MNLTFRNVVIAGTVLLASASLPASDASCSATHVDCARQIRTMMQGRAYLGVKLGESRWGVEVKSVVPGSPAETAGLRPGDRIHAINGQQIGQQNLPAVKRILSETRPSGRIYLTVVRFGTVLSLQTRVQRMSDDQIDKVIASHLRQAHNLRPAAAPAEVHASANE